MDTPEVARAKAAHLAAVAEAAANIPYDTTSYAENHDYHKYSKSVSVGHQIYHDEHKYNGLPAPLDHIVSIHTLRNLKLSLSLSLSLEGRIRIDFLFGSKKTTTTAQKHSSFSASLQRLVCFQGRVVDTPEVARAKAAHLAAYNHAASTAPVAVYDYDSQIYRPPIYNGYRDRRMLNTPEAMHAVHLYAPYANAALLRNAYYDDY